jgi:hypothetical protein
MNKLHELLTTVDTLNACSSRLLQHAIPVMPHAKKPSKDMIDAVMKARPKTKLGLLQTLFETAILDIVSDAEKTQDELDGFLQHIAENTPIDDETFLGTVWHGDMYDARHGAALKMLVADMEKQCSSLEKRGKMFLVETVINSIRV